MTGPSDTLPLPRWHVLPGLSDYAETVARMEREVDAIARGEAPEQVWLVEHPPVLTAGTSADPADLLHPDRFPVVPVGRGGRYTYHGPGQRVIYPLLDLSRRGRDVRRLIDALEGWAIDTLGAFGVRAFGSELGTGIWVDPGDGPRKIGAIGIRIRRWVSFHGMALNVGNDLSHFDAIVPCGIASHGVTRLADLCPEADMAALDSALQLRLPEMLHRLSAGADTRIKTLEAASDCR